MEITLVNSFSRKMQRPANRVEPHWSQQLVRRKLFWRGDIGPRDDLEGVEVEVEGEGVGWGREMVKEAMWFRIHPDRCRVGSIARRTSAPMMTPPPRATKARTLLAAFLTTRSSPLRINRSMLSSVIDAALDRTDTLL